MLLLIPFRVGMERSGHSKRVKTSTEDMMISWNRSPQGVAALLLAAGLSFGHVALAGQPHGGHATHAGEEIGSVDFQVSCEGAREDFDRALGLMHHMMYEQARSGFQNIAEANPECAMAYWGIATTMFQPLWPERPSKEALEQGWRQIQKAQELEPPTERERMLVRATEAFFRGPETAAYGERINRWAEGMSSAYQVNPDDLDTAALYALSRLALAMRLEAHERDRLHTEAERILREVWEKEPRHPGAIHYSIHATDVEGRAGHALEMVEVYGTIAPEVPHSLHMPSHIYVRLGDWPKVIDWNQRSADAALRKPVNGSISFHYIHAIDYMLYAHLQQGEDDEARALFRVARAKGKHQSSYGSAYHLAAIPARMTVERRDWEAASRLEPRNPEYQPWDIAFWPEGITWYARGLGAVHAGDSTRARESEKRLEMLRDRANAAGEGRYATYIEVDRLILASWIARSEDNAEEAVLLMRSAAELEGTVEKDPITPGALLPPHEALGDLLMDLDRPAEALDAYRAADEIWPNRYNTMLGAARAAQAAGDKAAARKNYSRLLEIAGDSQRPGVGEARRYLDGSGRVP
jgi:tetratricopeptide (TPR) repeat protein